jgi:hypothetical protein
LSLFRKCPKLSKKSLKIMNFPSHNARAGLMAAVLIAAATSSAATTNLMGRIDIRPLVPSEMTGALATAEKASGLSTVPVGQPVYLDAQINLVIPASDIQSVTWTLTNQPFGSTVTLSNSPLGTNIPVYRPSDQLVYQTAGRAMLRPDMRGQYTVIATITTASFGTTNVAQNLTAGTYMGVGTCELCHSGGNLAPNIYDEWSKTLHSSMFSKRIDGDTPGYSKNCISCHTVGYDANPLAVNGGFDDVATQLGWTFPPVLTNGNWASMQTNYPTLANLANIQCENCHGPGSEHAYALGDTSRISVSFNPGDCGQCHDAPTHHIKNQEWNQSKHAIGTRVPSGPGREACVRCHTSPGFADYADQVTPPNTTYEAIGCAGCHDPHDPTNPHQLRLPTDIILPDGTSVTNAGMGGFCMNCHQSRTGSYTNSLVNYPQGLPTWAGGSRFGPHDSPVAEMLEGVNGYTYGQTIPSSAHKFAVSDTCVTCHMQTVGSSDPAFLQAGGHTFKMSYTVVSTNGVTNVVDKTDVCMQCHGPIDDFDMPRQDYNGDGIVEGVQTEVQHLIDKLSTLLPDSKYHADGNYVAAGVVQTSISTQTNWPAKFLEAAWNWQFVNNDGSKGVHNAAYAVGLLKASIGDLTGDANTDGLPDAWQIQYFGSINNPNAAPGATPAGDGVPNWLKYSLGLDPTVPGVVVPGGVVWADGNVLSSSSETNTIHIYTAAEVSFDTEAGKLYQLQSINTINGGWQNVGSPITGTGGNMSYVTPTRPNVQQYYRVMKLD